MRGECAFVGLTMGFPTRHLVVDAVEALARPGALVSIPRPDGTPGGNPTGTVFNYTGASSSFGTSAFFLWATEDGSISGWNPNVIRPVHREVNHSANRIYKGLAWDNPAGHDSMPATL